MREKDNIYVSHGRPILKIDFDHNNKQKTEQEFGDLLFALVNLARKNGINPDDALEYTNQKFRNRFMFIEDKAKAMNKIPITPPLSAC